LEFSSEDDGSISLALKLLFVEMLRGSQVANPFQLMRLLKFPMKEEQCAYEVCNYAFQLIPENTTNTFRLFLNFSLILNVNLLRRMLFNIYFLLICLQLLLVMIRQVQLNFITVHCQSF
jgi:hypothetical protein